MQYLAHVSQDTEILNENMLHCYHLKWQLIFQRTDWSFLSHSQVLSGASGSRGPRLSSSQEAGKSHCFFNFLPKIKAWQSLFYLAKTPECGKGPVSGFFTLQTLIYMAVFLILS